MSSACKTLFALFLLAIDKLMISAILLPMIACIDGGLICGPVLLVLGALGLGHYITRRLGKVCRKSCACKCHEKGKNE